jgi:hypothetical protein
MKENSSAKHGSIPPSSIVGKQTLLIVAGHVSDYSANKELAAAQALGTVSGGPHRVFTCMDALG